MSGERDPLLAAELARRPVFDHRPGFWDDLERGLRAADGPSAPGAEPDQAPGPLPPGGPRPGAPASGAPASGAPASGARRSPFDRPGHRRPRSRFRPPGRPGPHRGRWLLAAAVVLIAGGLTATLLPPRGDRGTSLSTDDPTATTTPAPVIGGGPPLVVDRNGEPLTSDLAVQVVLATVADLLATDRSYLATDDSAQRAQLLANGGLTVRTTIDAAAQRAALSARTDAPGGIGRGATITAIDPSTGAIVAAVDDDPVVDSLYRRTLRPDAAIAPVLLAAGFDRAGLLPEDTIDGRGPCELADPGGSPDPWKVDNPGGAAGSVAPVRQQIVERSSCAWARLGLAVGLDTLVETGTALGVGSGLNPYPSVSLGAADVPVVDLTSVYATLAAGGVHREPYLIESVSQGARGFYEHGEPVSDRAVSAETACRVTSVLASVRAVDEPEVAAPEAVGISGGRGGTGAGLYAGYTASLATTVWIGESGADDPDGGAAAVWNQFAAAYRPSPATGAGPLIQVCPESTRAPRPVEAG